MRHFARIHDPDSDEADEKRRLNREERLERDPEPSEDSPLVRYVRTHPEDAAAQIGALQEEAGYWAKAAHMAGWGQKGTWSHAETFTLCVEPECRKLRDRLRPVG